MVESRKKHHGHQAPIYLAFMLIPVLCLTGCAESTSYEIVNLHFKSASQIETILQYLTKDTPGIQFSDQTILIPSDTKNISIILNIIKEIDKPPTFYQLQFHKKNIRTRSTNTNKEAIFLTEGKETITQYNNQNIKITILKATSDSSLIDISSRSLNNKKNTYQKNHWLVKHNIRNEVAKDIFPFGFVLLPLD